MSKKLKRVENMRTMYEQGSTMREVGDQFGISGSRVQQIFKENGIPRRDPGRPGSSLPKSTIDKRTIAKHRFGKAKQRKVFTDSMMINALQTCAEETRPRFSSSNYEEWRIAQWPDRHFPSLALYQTRSPGKWNLWKSTAGLPTTNSRSGGYATKYTKQDMFEAIHRIQGFTGKTDLITINDYQTYHKSNEPSFATIKNTFGSWSVVAMEYNLWTRGLSVRAAFGMPPAKTRWYHKLFSKSNQRNKEGRK